MDNNRGVLVGTFSAAVALAAFHYSVTVKAPANIRPLENCESFRLQVRE